MLSMKCYSEKEGMKYQQCRKNLGYRTCFTQFDNSELVSLLSVCYLLSMASVWFVFSVFPPSPFVCCQLIVGDCLLSNVYNLLYVVCCVFSIEYYITKCFKKYCDCFFIHFSASDTVGVIFQQFILLKSIYKL